ncbi:MAG: YchJ family metal-binding protein [Hylemonella sp.]|uniref:YchJ family protein n=1 Tax=Hylemonella sp. TaxID=2066020 RepID=UPI0022BD3364|nr:YchJ family metal-binding protein [Hylemonella sp.]MCZ8252637.1 YchJ family metal-binding protein [Hylemonella sp.]
MSDCPCGQGLPYAQCCGLYVEDFEGQPAPDAEALMRSRYSAFVLERDDYLRATWYASKRPSTIRFDPGTKWLGLEVRDFKVLDDTHAEVEFVARQRDKSGRAVRLHERSRFVREDGRWYYVEGDWL